MKNSKRKHAAEERRVHGERKQKVLTTFVNGKQRRDPKPQLIDGLPVDEFIARNADSIWLHQNEMWEHVPQDDQLQVWSHQDDLSECTMLDDEIPF
jgi:hypothetical protein